MSSSFFYFRPFFVRFEVQTVQIPLSTYSCFFSVTFFVFYVSPRSNCPDPCMYVYIHTYVYIYTYVCVCVCVCVCACVCVCDHLMLLL